MQLIKEGKLYLINNGPYIAIAINDAPLKEVERFKNIFQNLAEDTLKFHSSIFQGYFTMPPNEFFTIIKRCFWLDYGQRKLIKYVRNEKDELEYGNEQEIEELCVKDAEEFIKSIPEIKKSLTSILKNTSYDTYTVNTKYQKYE